ncbi:MAG TPA: alpha-L-fucosidase [Acidobacteriaceae bacterium]|jgi:alpha-L-fucosidase|nr:alpha-L-fucosidase [Acidobacteriaceae bacterium]
MNRRKFLASTAALAAISAYPDHAQLSQPAHGFSTSELKNEPYIEHTPIAGYHSAPPSAYEAFEDMKFGVRIHWGIYSIWHRGRESWPFLSMSFEDRQKYNDLYKTWNPMAFDAGAWMGIFKESGMKMLAFTTKHHEGFSMFNTGTRVKSRTDWTAPGAPKIAPCDLAYSIMETPFRRDIVKELCDAAHRQDIKIDLYFSHADWYDADFRPYLEHPLQVPSSAKMMIPSDLERTRIVYGNYPVIVPDPTDAEVTRMMERHRGQLVELLTNYGRIDMVGLDVMLGPLVWPELRKTVLKMRELQPNVMLRNRGIGNYGDYYTPERVIPGSEGPSGKPWFTIYPLGTDFSYEPDAAKYKGTEWIIKSLADATSKGGGLQIGVGPSPHGEFHPEAVRQMKAAGAWLKVNGEAIYATRPLEGARWAEGDTVRYTRSKDHRFVYAILIRWPGTMVPPLRSVRPKHGSKVTLLGSDTALPWKFDSAQGTIITLPENLQQASNRPCKYAWTLKIESSEVKTVGHS